MRKLRIPKLVAVCFSLLLPLVALAEAPRSTRTLEPAADFLASLGGPQRSLKAACSASFACGDGNYASCTGNSSCQAFPLAVPAHVKCDGVKHYCPNMCFVQVACSPTGRLFCSSNVGDCQSGTGWVECDGEYYECPFG